VLLVATHTSEASLSEEAIVRELSANPEKSVASKGRKGFETWNSFQVRGEEKVVSLLTPPVMYGRFPNYRARDLTVQSADAIVVVVSPHKSSINAMATLDMVRRSLKGSFQKRYRTRNRFTYPAFGELDLSICLSIYLSISLLCDCSSLTHLISIFK